VKAVKTRRVTKKTLYGSGRKSIEGFGLVVEETARWVRIYRMTVSCCMCINSYLIVSIVPNLHAYSQIVSQCSVCGILRTPDTFKDASGPSRKGRIVYGVRKVRSHQLENGRVLQVSLATCVLGVYGLVQVVRSTAWHRQFP